MTHDAAAPETRVPKRGKDKAPRRQRLSRPTMGVRYGIYGDNLSVTQRARASKGDTVIAEMDRVRELVDKHGWQSTTAHGLLDLMLNTLTGLVTDVMGLVEERDLRLAKVKDAIDK